MASRARATTVGERPGAGLGPASSLRPSMRSDWDNKRISRDDMSMPRIRPQRMDYDKRISRDDLDIVSRNFDRANYKSYHIPIRGRLPSPETSPKHQTPLRVTTVRTTTPDSLEDNKDSGAVAIGMALGSPAHPPPAASVPWHPRAPVIRSHTLPVPSITTTASPAIPSTNVTVTSPPAGQDAQVKHRKWGIFGRSKSKKAKHPESVSSASPQSSTPRTLGKEHASKGSKHIPIISHEPPVPSLGASSRLLDIDIPDTTMERYSVMFSGVLDSQQPSSLLARRQANLDRLKTVKESPLEDKQSKVAKEKEEVEEEWPRPRIETTRAARSPSFTLFPSTPGNSNFNGSNPNLARLTPRSRSKTSPGILPSPSRDSFRASNESARHNEPKARHAARSEARNVSPKAVPRETSSSNARNYRPVSPLKTGESVLSAESITPTVPEPDVHIEGKLHPVFVEPAWQMVNPSRSNASVSSTASSHRRGTASSISSEHMSVTPLQNQTPASPPASEQAEQVDEQAQKALEDAVEISIARQISVSQQQRKLLQPLQGSVRRKDASPHGVGISTTITVGRKGSTPTLVHPPKDTDLSPVHRKSSRGIMEAA